MKAAFDYQEHHIMTQNKVSNSSRVTFIKTEQVTTILHQRADKVSMFQDYPVDFDNKRQLDILPSEEDCRNPITPCSLLDDD